MKTLKTVVKTIQELQNKDYSMLDDDRATKQKKKDQKTLQFLNVIKRYLMSQPKEEYLRSEVTRLDGIVSSVMERFIPPEGITRGELSKLRKEHEKEYDVPKFRRQLKTMHFILN